MGNMAANAVNARRVVAAVLDSLGQMEFEKVVMARRWEGGSKDGLSGLEVANQEKRQKAVEKLEWLLPGVFGK